VPGLRVVLPAVTRNFMESSPLMRFVGAAAVAVGFWTFVVAVARVMAAGGPFD
jgi:hypothetical protein